MIHNVMTESTIPPKGNKPTRGLHTLVKDTALASELARELSVPLLAGSVATQAYRSCEARGWLEHEHWAVMQIFEELANIRVRPEHSNIVGPAVSPSKNRCATLFLIARIHLAKNIVPGS